MNGLSTRRSVHGALAWLVLVRCSDPDLPAFSNAPSVQAGSAATAVDTGASAGSGPVNPVTVVMPAPGTGGSSSTSSTGSGGVVTEPPPEEPPQEPPALECGTGRVAAGGVCFCSSGAFGAPTLVTGFAVPGSTFGPSLSSDGLTLFFSLIDGVGENGPQGPNENDEDILFATRTTRSTEFAPAALVPGMDAQGSEEGTPFITADGLSLYFFSTRPGPGTLGDRDIWVAKRPSLSAEFGAPSVVPGINSPQLDHLPWVSADNLQLLFVSDRPASTAASNIWVASRPDPEAPFSEPVELAGINTVEREEGFSLSSDGLSLVFASNRPGSAGLDLWLATRGAPDAPFSEPQNLSELNSPASDGDARLSPDGLELFFSSERNGDNQIFRAERVCD